MATPATPEPSPEPLNITAVLLSRVHAGDQQALDDLMRRCLPALRRWVRGRLPASARDMMDTQDIVQNALLHTLARIDLIQESHEGAFLGYLRRAAFREIIDVIRRVKRRPTPEELPDSQASRDPSPLEIAIGREGVRRYEAALAQLRPKEQAAIVGRLEMHYDYKELALLLGVPNANAARAAVTRATKRLLDLLQYER